MKIVLVSVGTRGDMEPFLALAHLLKNEGHSLACMFPEQFRGLVEEMGITFLSLGLEFIDLLESEEGRLVMGGRGSVFKKAAAYFSLYRQSTVINRKMVNAQIRYLDQEAPDRVVYNGKSTGPLVWGCVHKGASILLSPVPYLIHPVYDHPHIGIGWSLGHSFNAWTYKLANFAFVQNIMSTTRVVRTQLGVDRRQVKRQLLNSELIYTISPALFSRPDYWPEQVKVLGYHERPKALTWRPDAPLLAFIERHEKILFVTFGSMTNPDSAAKSEIVRSIAEKHQIPTIINRAAGGLSFTKDYDDSHMYITDRIPYDWVLPHVHAIVHHGGSGTTHMGLKYGCATMVIPHIIDQFVWNDIITSLGAGPRGVSIQKFSRAKLEPKIVDLFSNHIYKKKAQEIAALMEQENKVRELIDSVVS